jgi:hypothetical protein
MPAPLKRNRPSVLSLVATAALGLGVFALVVLLAKWIVPATDQETTGMADPPPALATKPLENSAPAR